MRSLFLFLPALLGAQVAGPAPGPSLDLRTALGEDPATRIHLVYPGCWNGLLLGTQAPKARSPKRGPAGATVEVWDIALPESPRQEAFRLSLQELQARLSKALAAPPASHGFIELGELMASDPSNPQRLDLTRVQSLQNRFNRLPPAASPVR